MDVGNPSNFSRMLELFNGDYKSLSNEIKGYSFTDEETAEAMRHVYATRGYILDPHGAVGLLGLKKYFQDFHDENAIGIFLETAHPSKFKDVVDETLGKSIDVHPTLREFMKRQKETVKTTTDFAAFKEFLLNKF